MRILWDKKLIRLSDGSYIAWGIKRKKFFFANKNELKLNCAIIEYYKEREKCDKKVISDLNKIIAELKEELKKWKVEWQEQVQKENDESYARTLQTIQLNKAKMIISNLYAICKDNHYPNTSVLMEQAEQFLKEIKEND